MNIHLQGAMRQSLLIVCCALLASSAFGQTDQAKSGEPLHETNKDNVADAIAKVKSGDFARVHVDLIGRAGAVEAIPVLEEQFVRVQDPIDKAKIAQVLIKLGDKDNTYWDYMVKLVTPALESDAPDFMSYDSQGKSSPGPSPAFIAWAKAHNVPPNGPDGTAAEDSIYTFPGTVGLLAYTGDPRAIPLLRRALLSPNHMIETMAALGLAEVQDKDSIPLIIEACKRAPAEAAAGMAQSLVYFDDARAQSAVDTYVPKDAAKIFRDAKAQGKKTPWSN
jgi:hypothetical protein